MKKRLSLLLCLCFLLGCFSVPALADGDGTVTIEPGTVITFGNFYTDLTDQKNPIEWIVYKIEENGCAYLVSRYALAGGIYDTYGGMHAQPRGWNVSVVRSWLGYDFFNMAFSEEERMYLRPITVHDIRSIDVADYVTLPTSLDALILKSRLGLDAPVCAPTAYAERFAPADPVTGNCKWWVRNTEMKKGTASYFDESGKEKGTITSTEGIGIRPMILLDLSALAG